MALIGKAALTTCRTETQGYVLVPAGVQVPGDILEEDAKRLLAEGYLVERESSTDDDDRGGDKPAKVDDILAEVGEDKAKATEALEAEKARGDAARTTLLAKLQSIVDA